MGNHSAISKFLGGDLYTATAMSEINAVLSAAAESGQWPAAAESFMCNFGHPARSQLQTSAVQQRRNSQDARELQGLHLAFAGLY